MTDTIKCVLVATGGSANALRAETIAIGIAAGCRSKPVIVTVSRGLSGDEIHVVERVGLGLVGAAAGHLSVGIQAGATIPALTNPTFLLVTIVVGAVGFFLGIDTPAHRFQAARINLPGDYLDASELFTAVGTVPAALAAFISLALIVLVLESSQLSASAC